MTKFLEQALRQVERLSENEQDAAGAALIDYLAHREAIQLSDAQLAEVRNRRADPDRKLVSHAEAKERLGRLPG
jgi:VIT1/CCC1 family predicted Fe2+/Mn2+ transporter